MKRKRHLTKGNKWFRKELNLLWDAVYRWTTVQPLPGWAETPSGMIPPKEPIKTPPFSFMVDGTTAKTLYVYPGYLNAPKSTSAANEIPDYYLYPYMPQINATSLDASSPSGLSLTNNATNYVYMPITWVERQTTIGATTLGSNFGVKGFCSTTDDAAAPVVVGLAALSYHIDEGNWPSFLVTTGGFPTSSEGTAQLVANIPWGKFVMGSSGVVNSREWYWTGHRDIHPPNHIMGSNTPDNGGTNPS